jgi:hypothetical protein
MAKPFFTMKNLKLFPVLLVLFVAFLASNSYADKPHTEHYDLTLWADFDVEFCKGEHIVGWVTFKVVEHYDKDGNITKAHWNALQGEYLVGTVSDDVYMAKGSNNWNLDFTPGAQTTSIRWNIILQGKGQHLRAFYTVHYVMTPDGKVTVDVETRTDNCK